MVRTLPSAASPRLDFQRILAISFAMAVHALALLVLLLPLTSPPLPEARNAPEPERWKIVRPLPPSHWTLPHRGAEPIRRRPSR